MPAIMKKTEIGKRANTQYVRTSQQAKKVSRDERLPSASISTDNLYVESTKKVQQRKASTPTHDRTALSNSPDISCIQISEVKSNYSKKKVGSENPRLISVPRTAVQKEINLQDELEIEYTKYLQAVFKNKMAKSSSSKIDNDLIKLQQRIEENERILKQTTERLKSISFNKEIDELYKIHNPNFGKVLETLDSKNCEEYIAKLNTKLEQTQNQLKLKNIEIPQGGSAQLMGVITDTLSAFEKLKMDHDAEIPRILKEIKDENKSTVNSLKRCLQVDNLSTCENLLLNRATLEISSTEDSLLPTK